MIVSAHQLHIGDEVGRAVEAAFNRGLEKAAQLVETHIEGHQLATGKQYLSPKKGMTEQATNGLAYAAAIRQLKV